MASSETRKELSSLNKELSHPSVDNAPLVSPLGSASSSQYKEKLKRYIGPEGVPPEGPRTIISSFAPRPTTQPAISSIGRSSTSHVLGHYTAHPTMGSTLSSYHTAHSISSSARSFLTAPSLLTGSTPISASSTGSNPISELARQIRGAPIESPYAKLIRDRDLLQAPETMLDWSGRGQHVEFERHEQVPLVELEVIGQSKHAVVSEVQCRRIRLARKSMTPRPFKLPLEKVIKEVQHLQRLRHLHIVQLVGTYMKGPRFAMLMYPVADYNMESFLEHCGFVGMQVADLDYEQLRCRESLMEFFVCLLHALKYIHESQIKHRDIKPGNILVRGPVADVGYRVYICDFGISTFFLSEESTQTEGPTEHTPRYCAPEVSNYESRGRAADVFSLGCVFLEMCTALSGESNNDFTDYRRQTSASGRDGSFHANPEAVQRWIRMKLRQCPTKSCPRMSGPLPPLHECPAATNAEFIIVSQWMVQLSALARPSASDALSSLPTRVKTIKSHSCDAEREVYESCEARDLDLPLSRLSFLAAEFPDISVVGLPSTQDIRVLSNYLAEAAKDPLKCSPFLPLTCRYVDFISLVQKLTKCLLNARSYMESGRPKLAEHEAFFSEWRRLSSLYDDITSALLTYDIILALKLVLDLEDMGFHLHMLLKKYATTSTGYKPGPYALREKGFISARNITDEVWLMLSTRLGPNGKGNPPHRVEYLRSHLITLLKMTFDSGLSIKDFREKIESQLFVSEVRESVLKGKGEKLLGVVAEVLRIRAPPRTVDHGLENIFSTRY